MTQRARSRKDLGIGVFHDPARIQWFEDILLKHLSYKTTFGLYLHELVIEDILRLYRRWDWDIVCPYCERSHFMISGKQIVRNFYLKDPQWATAIYEFFGR